jgi:Cytochrome P460
MTPRSSMLAILSLLLLVADCSRRRSQPMPVAFNSQGPFIALERDFQDFRSWEAIDLPDKSPQGITHVAGKRREFINQRPGAGSRNFPVGTMLVKEILTGAQEGHQLFAMVKRGGGYNSDGAPGWEWFELREREDRTIGVVWRGINAPKGEHYGGDPMGGCNSCHEVSAKNDFVRSRALALASR